MNCHPQIEIAICTWNRCHSLDRTLKSLTRLNLDRVTNWTVLVVDNNCTDETQSVVQSYKNTLPIRSVIEPETGLSNARNRAISETKSDFILWTDDDVVVDRNWLENYYNALQENPHKVFFGGVIEAGFEGNVPQWLEHSWQDVSEAFAVRNLGSEQFDFDLKRVPFGANFGVRTNILREFRFNPKLGRRGFNLSGGEETALCRELLRSGHQGRWIPNARVTHMIPQDRQTKKYLRRYFYNQGKAAIARARQHEPTKIHKNATFSYALGKELNYHYRKNHRPAKEWVLHLKEASLSWGKLIGRCSSNTPV